MPSRRGNRPRGLSDEERALWQSVTQDLKPLKTESDKSLADKAETQATSQRPERIGKASPAPSSDRQKSLPLLERGGVTDLDKRQAQRLKRGQMTIDATLDLHGYSQADAHRRLERFLAEAQAAGKRCVLLVTGRGLGKSAGGVLRSEVPRWLNQAPNRARVLAFDWAQPKHGGDGALYVLLRRNRPN